MANLKDLTVSWLSLVKTPANGKGLTLKSGIVGENQTATAFAFTKFDVEKSDEGERMVAYGIVYSPDETDLQGDTADAVTIRRAAYDFMREARLKNIDKEHSFDPEAVFVAESWLVRKGDELFPDEPIGSWAVGLQITDADLWNDLKKGDMTGISLAGFARETQEYSTTRYTEKGDQTPSWFANFIKSAGLQLGLIENHETPPNGDSEMTPDEITALAKAIAPAVAAQIKADAEAPPAAPAETAAPAAAAPAAEAGAENVGESIAKALEKGFEGLGTKLEDTVAKAVAKGVSETGGDAQDAGETFA